VDTAGGNGTIRLDLANVSLGGPYTFGEFYTIEKDAPLVVSINRASASPSSAAGVNYTVTFDKSVTGVDAADFSPVTTGVFTVAPAVINVTGSGTTYTVTVGNYKTNSGTLGLNLVDNDSIIDAASISLGGPLGAADGSFTGEIYTIDNVAPTVVSSVLASTNPTKATTVDFTVTFSETVAPVYKSDFSLTTTGITGAGITTVSGTGTTRTVTVNTGSGSGTLRLNVLDKDTIKDGLFTPLNGLKTGTTFSTGESYTVDKLPPTVVSITPAYSNPNAGATVAFTVTFSKSVNSVFIPSFSLNATGVSGASIASVSGSGSIRTVLVNTGTGSGTIRLDVIDTDVIVDATGNPLGGMGLGNGSFTTGQAYTIDKTAPIVSTIVRASTDPTSAASVNFTATFSEAVTGVDVTDFALTAPGITGASVTSVSGSGAIYTVAVNTGADSGTLRLDLNDDDSIKDIAGSASNPLGGVGIGNGSFTSGESYTISRTPPVVVSINRTYGNPTSGSTLFYTVTFSEAVTGVYKPSFALATTGTITGASVSSVSGSGTTYTVLVNSGTGDGTIRLDLIDTDVIKNALNIPLGGSGAGNGTFTTGQEYTVVKSAPVVVSINRTYGDPTAASTLYYTVTFSQSVTSVFKPSFTLTTTGAITGASVLSISGSGTTYTVQVNSGTGDGTIRLDLIDTDVIKNVVNIPLGGTGAGNGTFTTGQTYTIVR
jgi:hypothetical protein